MKEFSLDGFTFKAQRLLEGILVDPEIPRFEVGTAHGSKHPIVDRWVMRPYIQTSLYIRPRDETLHEEFSAAWERSWPSGIRYEVRCLDHSLNLGKTSWGYFATIEQALECIRDRKLLDHREEISSPLSEEEARGGVDN